VVVPVVIFTMVLVNQEGLAAEDRVGEQMRAVPAQQGKDTQVEPVQAVLPALHQAAVVVLAQWVKPLVAIRVVPAEQVING
jgi:hypothetical protein